MQWCDAAERLCTVRDLGDGIVEWALEHITDGLFVDGGACVGMFAIPILLARPNARCVAFEPGQSMRDALLEMAQLNGVSDRIELYQVALYDSSGMMTLKISTVPMQAGLSTLGEPRRFGKWRTEQVNTMPLDCLHLEPEIIKLDLEGAEIFALRGAEQTIGQHRPALIVEAWPPNTRQFGYEPEAIGNFLTELGYTCRYGREDYFCTA